LFIFVYLPSLFFWKTASLSSFAPLPFFRYTLAKDMIKSSLPEKMKAVLEQERVRLEKELSVLGGAEVTYPESGGNSDDDNAAEITEYADEVSLSDRLKNELRDTVKALESIAKGTYGKCKYCGKEIDIKRLEARPTSSSCIDCKKSLTQEM
jgi:RNA polymerase-binding protein DksA